MLTLSQRMWLHWYRARTSSLGKSESRTLQAEILFVCFFIIPTCWDSDPSPALPSLPLIMLLVTETSSLHLPILDWEIRAEMEGSLFRCCT